MTGCTHPMVDMAVVEDGVTDCCGVAPAPTEYFAGQLDDCCPCCGALVDTDA
jgi:hypothetical protein